MKIFAKWTGKAILLLGVVIAFLEFEHGLENGFDPAFFISVSLPTLVVGALILGGFFYLLETRYVPWRMSRIRQKIIRMFDATRLSDTVNLTNINGYDLYIETAFNLRMSESAANIAQIIFHIPREQFDSAQVKLPFKRAKSQCMNISTYRIFETNHLHLKRIKRKLENKL